MGRGDNRPTRVSLDEIFRTSRHSKELFRKTTKEEGDALIEIWRDAVTGILSREDGPALIKSRIVTGHRYHKEWVKDGLPHREGGLPAFVLRDFDNNLTNEGWLEEGFCVEGPEGFTNIDVDGDAADPERSIWLSRQRTYVKDGDRFEKPPSSKNKPSEIMLNRKGNVIKIIWLSRNTQAMRARNLPANITYHDPLFNDCEAGTPAYVRYETSKGIVRDDGPCFISYDADGSVSMLKFSHGGIGAPFSISPFKNNPGDKDWMCHNAHTGYAIEDGVITFTARSGAEVSFPFLVPEPSDFAPEKILNQKDFENVATVFKRYNID